MKTLLINLSVVTFLLSCSSFDSSRIAPGYKEAFFAINNLISTKKNKFNPQVISSIPYASAIVSFGNGPNALMILESKLGNEYTWVSADGVYLVTKDGIVIKTAGLDHNLTKSISLTDLSKIDFSEAYYKYLSFDKPILKNLKVKVTYKYIGLQKIPMNSSEKNLYLIEQILENEYLGWKVKNKFWVDENNYVHKSEQYISPRLPKVHIEITKKPA